MTLTRQDKDNASLVELDGGVVARNVQIVSPDGTPATAATEATLQEVNAKLADLKTYTDQLESITTTISNLNTQILAATDDIEPLLIQISDAVDTVESLLSTANTTASSILSAVDQLEGYTDGLETLIGTTNSTLSTISTLLSTISGTVSSIDTKTDVNLSTRASETTALLMKARLDLLATESTLSAINTTLDVSLSTRASEATLSSLKSRADLLATEATLITRASESTLSTRASESTLSSALTELQGINAGVPTALGQTTKSASMPITIASDQEYPYSGANNGANPSQAVSLGADDSANIRRLQGRITDPLKTDFGLVVRQIPRWPQTFSAHADNVAIGNGKSMLSLFNATGSGVVIRIHEIKIFNVQTTALVGVIAEFGLRKITTHSAGTQLTTTGAATGMIYPRDSNNSLNANVTARTGATVTESPAFDIENWFWSSDEWGVGTADVESMDHAFAQSIAAFKSSDGVQPYVLRPGEGMHVRQATNSVNGTFDIMFVFTQETA